MDYISVAEFAFKHKLSERTVRNYCTQGRIPGAFLMGKTWNIPKNAVIPARKRKAFSNNPLLNILKEQKDQHLKGSIYHRTQIDLTYNSNHIEGSKLTHEDTRMIFETHTIGMSEGKSVNIDDIMETVNHFRCFDRIIDEATSKLTESFIKQLHAMLKTGTSDSQKDWFRVGDYKILANEVGGHDTTPPADVHQAMKELLTWYNGLKTKTMEDIVDFHCRFETIHPFQDGNGRVGRLIMFKECLANHIVPFIIDESLRFFYYRGLQQWPGIKGYLLDTCLTAQDNYKELLQRLNITTI